MNRGLVGFSGFTLAMTSFVVGVLVSTDLNDHATLAFGAVGMVGMVVSAIVFLVSVLCE